MIIEPPFQEPPTALSARLRPWLRWGAIVAGVGAGVAAGVTLAEARLRARLDPPTARAPTMLLTRPVPWGNAPDPGPPVPVGPLAARLEEFRVPVYLDDLPDHLAQAVLAVEDRRFYQHGGLDPRRIVGAAVANVRAGGVTQGGSTITQQLAKNLFLTARRTPLRKLREAALALALEDRYEKREILEAYLNEIYLGQDGGRAIHGVGAAARVYFGKEARDLTLGESALLAGLIRAPNRYAPTAHADRARERRDLVLRLMVEQDVVDRGAADRAARERIRTQPAAAPAGDARYFRDFVVARLEAEGVERLPERGAVVYTTLDPGLQRAAEAAVREQLAAFGADGVEAALVALDPRTGDVLAMVGGRDYGVSQFNRAADARRQPGSAFKAVVALAALGRTDSGVPAYTLASTVDDEPLAVETAEGSWEPENYDRDFRGGVTLRRALEQSLNVPIARVGMTVGARRIAETGRRLGIESRLRAVPSLALGASEVTPLELTRAYGVFAAGGTLAATRTVLGVGRAGGSVEMAERVAATRVAEAAEAYLVTTALEGVVSRGTGRGLLRLNRRAGLAGKTGTTSGWRDGWFVAYTPSLVVGVWVGYDDGRPLNVAGSRSALPVVAAFLREALRRDPGGAFPVPVGIERVYLETRGWWIFGGGCSDEPEAFLAGTAPKSRCGRVETGGGDATSGG